MHYDTSADSICPLTITKNTELDAMFVYICTQRDTIRRKDSKDAFQIIHTILWAPMQRTPTAFSGNARTVILNTLYLFALFWRKMKKAKCICS